MGDDSLLTAVPSLLLRVNHGEIGYTDTRNHENLLEMIAGKVSTLE